MNFNYSYRSFLISLLLVGGLILFMYLIKLPKDSSILEEVFDLEYTLEDLFPEEELTTSSSEKEKIETHRAYNEAEKFISELEKERTESEEEQPSEANDAVENTTNTITILEREEAIVSENDDKEKVSSLLDFNNRNSTNSYRLIDRTALFFPNPVYTCEGYGKVVLHIEVNNKGEIIHVSINKNSSTTTNQCLIDSALKYAEKARFSTSKNRAKQMGSITYFFPGQQ